MMNWNRLLVESTLIVLALVRALHQGRQDKHIKEVNPDDWLSRTLLGPELTKQEKNTFRTF